MYAKMRAMFQIRYVSQTQSNVFLFTAWTGRSGVSGTGPQLILLYRYNSGYSRRRHHIHLRQHADQELWHRKGTTVCQLFGWLWKLGWCVVHDHMHCVMRLCYGVVSCNMVGLHGCPQYGPMKIESNPISKHMMLVWNCEYYIIFYSNVYYVILWILYYIELCCIVLYDILYYTVNIILLALWATGNAGLGWSSFSQKKTVNSYYYLI